MAKTSTINFPSELSEDMKKAIKQSDRFTLGSVGGKGNWTTRSKKRRYRNISLFRFLAEFWAELSETEKDEWREAGLPSFLTNWQLYISMNAAQIRNGLAITNTASEKWQTLTCRLVVESPAEELKIKQSHQYQYWETESIPGEWWKERLTLVTELVTLPLTVGLSYKANLSAVGSEQIARYFARVWSIYQGEDYFTEVGVDLNPSTDWTTDENTLSEVPGYIQNYDLFFHLKGYQGTLNFDNIRAEHTEQNWARDPRCDDPRREFKRGFAVVRPYWVPEVLPEGADFDVSYPPAE